MIIMDLLQDMALSSSFWQNHYTSNDTWLPLILPFMFWTLVWIYRTFLVKKTFANFYQLHSFHHIIAISMGLISMYFDDDTIFNERIVILWSTGYFIMDILDCMCITHDVAYLFHGSMCFILGLLNYNVPLLRTLRMNSKATLIETSTLLLHQVQQTKDPMTFIIFAILFTCCRIIWIPIMMKELYENDAHYMIMGLMIVFYALQVFWWMKIIRIIIRGGRKENKKDE